MRPPHLERRAGSLTTVSLPNAWAIAQNESMYLSPEVIMTIVGTVLIQIVFWTGVSLVGRRIDASMRRFDQEQITSLESENRKLQDEMRLMRAQRLA